MFSSFNFSRLAVSISTVAFSVGGTFISVNPQIVAQSAPKCVPAANISEGTQPLPGNVPANVRNAAQAAANATTKPTVKLTRFDSEKEDGVTIYELAGVQSNGCKLEIDAIAPNKIEEIETELATLNQVPAPVRNTLNKRLPASSFKVTFIERSQRPQPPKPVPPLSGVNVVYEIEGTCTRAISGTCKAGEKLEADINENGTTIVVESAS